MKRSLRLGLAGALACSALLAATVANATISLGFGQALELDYHTGFDTLPAFSAANTVYSSNGVVVQNSGTSGGIKGNTVAGDPSWYSLPAIGATPPFAVGTTLFSETGGTYFTQASFSIAQKITSRPDLFPISAYVFTSLNGSVNFMSSLAGLDYLSFKNLNVIATGSDKFDLIGIRADYATNPLGINGAVITRADANQVLQTIDTPTSGAPEASTWALLIAGFGAVGTALRRRQRSFAA